MCGVSKEIDTGPGSERVVSPPRQLISGSEPPSSGTHPHPRDWRSFHTHHVPHSLAGNLDGCGTAVRGGAVTSGPLAPYLSTGPVVMATPSTGDSVRGVPSRRGGRIAPSVEYDQLPEDSFFTTRLVGWSVDTSASTTDADRSTRTLAASRLHLVRYPLIPEFL